MIVDVSAKSQASAPITTNYISKQKFPSRRKFLMQMETFMRLRFSRTLSLRALPDTEDKSLFKVFSAGFTKKNVVRLL